MIHGLFVNDTAPLRSEGHDPGFGSLLSGPFRQASAEKAIGQPDQPDCLTDDPIVFLDCFLYEWSALKTARSAIGLFEQKNSCIFMYSLGKESYGHKAG